MSQATQLRISFDDTPAPSRLHIVVSGLTLVVHADVTDSELANFFYEHNITCERRADGGFSVPAQKLTNLVELVDTVQINPEAATLLSVCTYRPSERIPAALTVERGHLLLSWDDGHVAYDEYLHTDSVPALIASDIPFVATDDAWDRIEAASRAPATLGRCSVAGNGYIRIAAARPQLVEAAELSGLFRVDSTTFGLPLFAADELVGKPGFVWTSRKPDMRRPSGLSLPTHLTFAEHIRDDLGAFVAAVELCGARVIRWDGGLGRRVFALAALEALDANPAVVIGAPSSLWAWRRIAELLGRTFALTHDRCDVSFVTYHDLRHRTIEAQAVIYDDPFSDEARAGREHAQRIGRQRDAFHLMVCATEDWPDDDLGEQVAALSVIRPDEFRSGAAVAERYPLYPEQRCREHIETHVASRSWSHTGADPGFKHSSVATVELSEAQELHLAAIAPRLAGSDHTAALSEVLETVCAGPPHALSPKIAAAVDAVVDAHAKQQTIAVCSRHPRTITLLRAMLRPQGAVVLTAGAADPGTSPVTLVRFDVDIPDLRTFDQVWFLDYPWSFSVLEDAVGDASVSGGPDVVVVHSPGSVDDRLALLAGRRAELSHLTEANVPPNVDEIGYLLARR